MPSGPESRLNRRKGSGELDLVAEGVAHRAAKKTAQHSVSVCVIRSMSRTSQDVGFLRCRFDRSGSGSAHRLQGFRWACSEFDC